MPEAMTCKTKSAALAALGAIAETMRGVQRDTLKAVSVWIIESVRDDPLPGDIAARLQRIFEGTPGEQAGKEWIDDEMKAPEYRAGTAIEGLEGRFYHKPINEPEHGAELPCFYNAHTKTWEPDFSWPPVLPQSDLPENEGNEDHDR